MHLPRNADLWLPGYLRSLAQARARRHATALVHVVVCLVDHFEPGHGARDLAHERIRIARRSAGLETLADRFADSSGHAPVHTLFFPAEQYRPEHLDALAAIAARGLGEVEVHLHHDEDSSNHFRDTVEWFRDVLRTRHGLLSRDRNGNVVYGFVHGNWALDNSHPQGRWCGVNDEIAILRETGCYADFTMPSAPDPCQTRTINSIYYAVDDRARPKSHDRGVEAAVGRTPPPDGLLLVQGPLTLLWSNRKYGLLPRLENGALDATNPPSIERFRAWLQVAPAVRGRPDWIFVKLHAHGAVETDADVVVGNPMERFLGELTEWVARHSQFRVHFATAREVANMIRAAEAGETGNPCTYRDYCYRRD